MKGMKPRLWRLVRSEKNTFAVPLRRLPGYGIGRHGYTSAFPMSRRRRAPVVSVLASNFANHSHCASANHLPDALHGCEVPVQVAVETTSAASWLDSVQVSGQWLARGVGLPCSTIGIAAKRHGPIRVYNRPMTPVGAAVDPWPLLRNGSSRSSLRALRLVVHGRSGGEIPTCLRTLADELQSIRRAPVQLEVLTAEEQSPPPPECPAWLVPLLLWPGEHVCSDVPAIRDRLRAGGASITMLPFLGAWPHWWASVLTALQAELCTDSVLVHHPLRPGVADRFLAVLASRVDPLLVPFDRWPDHLLRHPDAVPVPLALAPNRITEALREAGGMPPLLEHPLTRQALIELLAALP